MKRVCLALLILALAGAGYVASPFVAAFRIGEAIKAGDSAYLTGKIEWPSVRNSLRHSLGPVALGIPDPGLEEDLTYWQRFKLRLGQGSVDRIVDAYVTPERLPQLFTLGRTYQELTGRIVPERTLANLPRRIAETWSRIKRGVFLTPTLFEIEAEDRFTPERRYVGVLRLQGTEWRLVALTVKIVSPVGEVVQAGAYDEYSEYDEELGAPPPEVYADDTHRQQGQQVTARED
jgi:hypothetical protein